MRHVLIISAALVALAGAAHAQAMKPPEPLQVQDDNDRATKIENEKKYNDAMRRTHTGAAETKADPWRNIRSPDTQKQKTPAPAR